MAEIIVSLICAGTVSLGIIVFGKGIINGLAIGRRPSHHLATETGTKPVPPEAQVPPQSGG